MKLLLKKMWGETEDIMLLFLSALFLGGRLMKCERWEGSKVANWES